MAMDLKSLHKDLLPCDVESPYVFVSYSSKDKEIVWDDVVELQHRGYNLWIDEANLDMTKDSWEEDALKAIESSNCVLLAFYVSRNSLTSEACLNEIETTKGELTIKKHFGNVPFFAIECENINNIGDYIQSNVEKIQSSNLEKREKDKLIPILFDFSKRWFTPDNKKVRIHSKYDRNRFSDYFEDIEIEFKRHQREAKFKPERLYRFAVDNIVKENLYSAIKLLMIGAKSYLPASLLLSHFLRNSLEFKDDEQAKQLWNLVERTIPSHTWGQRGKEEEMRRCYSEAIAWLLAFGEKYRQPEYLYDASKNWVKKGCKEQTVAVLKLAAAMGYEKASLFLPVIQRESKEKFLEKASTNEEAVI